MKFEEAFEKAFDRLDSAKVEEGILGVTPKTAKTLVFFWNMMKEAKGKFGDFVAISSNNNIISIDSKDPIKKNKGGSVFDKLDDWSEGKDFSELTNDDIGGLLSVVNEDISTGVYLHELMQWIQKKGIELTDSEIKNEEASVDDKKNLKKDDIEIKENKKFKRLEEVLAKEWYENENFPEELAEDQIAELFEKAKKEIKTLKPDELLRWLVDAHNVRIKDSEEKE